VEGLDSDTHGRTKGVRVPGTWEHWKGIAWFNYVHQTSITPYRGWTSLPRTGNKGVRALPSLDSLAVFSNDMIERSRPGAIQLHVGVSTFFSDCQAHRGKTRLAKSTAMLEQAERRRSQETRSSTGGFFRLIGIHACSLARRKTAVKACMQ
jgi:hypothetical protein